MKHICDIREGDNVSEVYFVKNYQQLKSKVGKAYGSITLQDKTGTLDAKIWDYGPGIAEFDTMDFVFVSGSVTSFQGQLQLRVNRLRKCEEDEVDVTEYMPSSERDIDEMYTELLRFVQGVKQPHLHDLLRDIFIDDKDFQTRFKKHSAAKSVHHAFIGGLLEHTLGVVKTCEFMSKQYPYLNHDLLITAALCHDIGKLDEISAFPENDYTDEGNLVGHIYMGAHMIEKRIDEMPDFPVKLRSELVHCILAHHGELEYGSPKKPALAEAVALTLADNVDAKLETMKETLLAGDPNATWVGYSKWFESNIRRTTDSSNL
ncbi:MAG: HD domain-containing protein [Lachnospiraceae bacterium]|nr:HD domain-containing protein [Lachnospiraceae bacterium]